MTEARSTTPTVTFVDEYCQRYQDLFPDVRSFEHFKQIQVGMLSEIKRKTLLAIAKATGESDPQALHHFVAYAPWHVEALREKRLTLLRQILVGPALRKKPCSRKVDKCGTVWEKNAMSLTNGRTGWSLRAPCDQSSSTIDRSRRCW
jgi:DDE superfamily endonuclease